MTRKFKVWDSYLKEFDSKKEYFLLNPKGKLLRKHQDGSYVLASTDFTLVFSTNHTVKNGDEIYGGDIITHQNIDIKYIVEWHDCGWGAREIGSKTMLGLSFSYYNLEIIGSKYQNPELLTPIN